MAIDSSERLLALIESRLGISPKTSRQLLSTQLSQATTVQALLAGDSAAWQALIRALTISETYFLRNQEQFQQLQQKILPTLLQERRRENDLRLTLWSVACSTGEEAYSLATSLVELLPDLSQWKIQILGTDINQQALEQAQRAIYRQWSFRETPPLFQKQYFRPVDDGFQLLDTIRNMVSFQQSNILEGSALSQVDLIFCRNMLMYFSDEQAQKVEQRLYHALVAGGYLFLGQAEAAKLSLWEASSSQGVPIYRKVSRLTTQTLEIPQLKQAFEGGQYYQDALKALRADDTLAAQRAIAEALLLSPQDCAVNTLTAYLCASRADFMLAEAYLQIALKTDALYADAHYLRGLILLEQGATDAALEALTAATYSQREHALAWFTLGTVYQQIGDSDRARKAWLTAQRALENLEDPAYLADISEMQVGQLTLLIQEQLKAD